MTKVKTDPYTSTNYKLMLEGKLANYREVYGTAFDCNSRKDYVILKTMLLTEIKERRQNHSDGLRIIDLDQKFEPNLVITPLRYDEIIVIRNRSDHKFYFNEIGFL